jgi:hypothetical protein
MYVCMYMHVCKDGLASLSTHLQDADDRREALPASQGHDTTHGLLMLLLWLLMLMMMLSSLLLFYMLWLSLWMCS